jgi:MYXO-CTERM domain-containing protein
MSTFHVNATNDGPGVPTTISPADGALLVEGPATLVAGNASDPEGDELTYTFEIANEDGSTTLATGTDVAEGDGATAWEITGVTFEVGMTYNWRVQATDGTSNSDFTAWSSFTLYEEPDIEEYREALVPDDGCGCRGTAANAGWLMAFIGVFAFAARRRRSR